MDIWRTSDRQTEKLATSDFVIDHHVKKAATSPSLMADFWLEFCQYRSTIVQRGETGPCWHPHYEGEAHLYPLSW